MRVLGVDYGRKYIGLAVGDTEHRIATPLAAVGASAAIARIGELIGEHNIEKIIIGLPLSFKMEETAASRLVRNFGRLLEERFGVAVEYENEVLTTDAARRLTGHAYRQTGKKSHSASAVLILQSYFDRIGV